MSLSLLFMSIPFFYEAGKTTIELSGRFIIWSGKMAIELVEYIRISPQPTQINLNETKKVNDIWIDLESGKELDIGKDEKPL